ncbi:MAG: hypothetical protein ABH859_01100 [Pseudomonadota bacterium]
MKKILILLFILLPITALAQWDWNVKPTSQDEFLDIYEMSGPTTEMKINYDVLNINPLYLIPILDLAALEFEKIPGQGLALQRENIIETMQESYFLAQKIDRLINQKDFLKFSGKDLSQPNSSTSNIINQLIKGSNKGSDNNLLGQLTEDALNLSSYSILNKFMNCHGIDATTCYDVYAKFVASIHAGLKGLYLTSQQENFQLEDKDQDTLYISTYGLNRDPETWAEFFDYFSQSLKDFMQSSREAISYLENR